jgi:hypothetical protein
MRCGINELTQETKPKQSQNKAIKSFGLEGYLQNKAKTKPLSPFKSGWVKKQSQWAASRPPVS